MLLLRMPLYEICQNTRSLVRTTMLNTTAFPVLAEEARMGWMKLQKTKEL